MKISDYIFLAKKNLSRRKGSVISITILITIAVIISKIGRASCRERV